MAAAAKRSRSTTLKLAPKTAPRRFKELPPRNPMYSWAYIAASNSSEDVTIHRNLEVEGNGFGGYKESDPELSVYFVAHGSPLHPDEGPPDLGDGWSGLRASDLHSLIDALQDAVDAAVRTGVIPPPLTDEAFNAAVEAAKRNAGAVREG